MAITALCSQTDLGYILSTTGVVLRLAADADGSADSGIATAVLEEGTVLVYSHLLQRYSVAVIAASTWAKWAAAYMSIRILGRRRGNTMPKSLLEEATRWLESLERIRDGKASLISDTGLSAPKVDALPTVSNMTVDGRFAANNVRRVKLSSTGDDAADGAQQNNANYWPYREY